MERKSMVNDPIYDCRSRCWRNRGITKDWMVIVREGRRGEQILE